MTEIRTQPDQTETVSERVLYLTDDCLRMLENELWAELDTDILMGWKSHEEAVAEFMAWRAGYRAMGSAIIEDIIREEA